MLVRRNKILAAIILLGDITSVVLALMSAYYIRFFSGLPPLPDIVPPFSQYYKILPLLVVSFPLFYQLNGLYKVRRGKSRTDEFISIFMASAMATLLVFLGLLYYRVYNVPDIAPEWEFSRLALVYFLFIVVVYVSAFRFILRSVQDHLRRKGINTRKILIAGAGDLGRELVDRIISHEELGLRAVGFIDDDERKRGSVYQGVRVVGNLDDLQIVILDFEPDVLFICLPPAAHAKILNLIDASNKHCIEVRVVPDLLQYISFNASVELFDGLPIINFDLNPMSGYKRVLKRGFDILFSIVGLIFTAILFPLLALVIKLSSSGPFFFSQTRMGIDGKPFRLVKFRTMKMNAEENGPVWAPTDDPRASPIGRFMRRTSLDELPQFWNVLRGEMSLVGPRPERPEYVKVFRDEYPNYMLRHKVKAGITGWAQVNGWRGDTSLEKRVEYDLYYIQNWSLALDIKIIWLTVSRSIFGRSPY